MIFMVRKVVNPILSEFSVIYTVNSNGAIIIAILVLPFLSDSAPKTPRRLRGERPAYIIVLLVLNPIEL